MEKNCIRNRLLHQSVIDREASKCSHPFSSLLLLAHRSPHICRHDVGSLNGTSLNRLRIESAELDDGDELQIGRFKLVFFHGTGA